MESQWSRCSEPFSRAIGSDTRRVQRGFVAPQEAAGVAVDHLARSRRRPASPPSSRSAGPPREPRLRRRAPARCAPRCCTLRSAGSKSARSGGSPAKPSSGRPAAGSSAVARASATVSRAISPTASSRQVAGRGHRRARAARTPHQGADPERALAGLLHEIDLAAAHARLERVGEDQQRVGGVGAGATRRGERLFDDVARRRARRPGSSLRASDREAVDPQRRQARRRPARSGLPCRRSRRPGRARGRSRSASPG